MRVRCLMILGVCVVLGGCSAWESPWSYNRPPTAAETGAVSAADRAGKPAVALGHLANPSRCPLRWRDIGRGMSDALGRQILNDGEFDVWIDPPLARQVEGAIDQTPDRRERSLERIRVTYPDLRYVLTGTVTDFTHTSDVPESARRRGFFGRKQEAVASIRLCVIDVERGRVVAGDHVYGAAAAPETPTAELYADVAFGSYLFWNMPLGKASEEAVRRAAGVLDDLVPPPDREIRITRQLGPRRVRLVGGTKAVLAPGREFYVCRGDEETGEAVAVHDPDTQRPLRARITEVGRHWSEAWLLGEKPRGEDLRGATLERLLPWRALSEAQAEAAGEDAPSS